MKAHSASQVLMLLDDHIDELDDSPDERLLLDDEDDWLEELDDDRIELLDDEKSELDEQPELQDELELLLELEDSSITTPPRNGLRWQSRGYYAHRVRRRSLPLHRFAGPC